MSVFESFDICAIDECPDEVNKPKIWCVIEKVIPKPTKTGKSYLYVTASGISEKPYNFKVWSNIVEKNIGVFRESNVVILGLNYEEDYGYSISPFMKVMKVTK